MTWVVITLAGAFATALGVVVALRQNYQHQQIGWRLLAHAGWPLVLAGAVFVVRFWTPTSGPYLANSRYPFGDHLAAWAVSFGFTWMAFGLLFGASALLAPTAATSPRAGRVAWLALLAAWALCWLPHGLIGVAVALGGLEPVSVDRYAEWAARPLGTVTLAADAVLLILHFSCATAGFIVTGRQVWRSTPRPPG